jgi:hypothetical protein
MLASSRLASSSPPSGGSAPVSARVVVTPSVVAWMAIARPLKVTPFAAWARTTRVARQPSGPASDSTAASSNSPCTRRRIALLLSTTHPLTGNHPPGIPAPAATVRARRVPREDPTEGERRLRDPATWAVSTADG